MSDYVVTSLIIYICLDIKVSELKWHRNVGLSLYRFNIDSIDFVDITLLVDSSHATKVHIILKRLQPLWWFRFPTICFLLRPSFVSCKWLVAYACTIDGRIRDERTRNPRCTNRGSMIEAINVGFPENLIIRLLNIAFHLHNTATDAFVLSTILLLRNV